MKNWLAFLYDFNFNLPSSSSFNSNFHENNLLIKDFHFDFVSLIFKLVLKRNLLDRVLIVSTMFVYLLKVLVIKGMIVNITKFVKIKII